MSHIQNRDSIPDQPAYDPLALPSETRVRFILLIAAALIVTFNTGIFLAPRFGILSPGDLYARFTEAGTAPEPGTFLQPDGQQIYQEYLHATIRSLWDTLLALLFPVCLILVVLLLAAILYRTHPRRVLAGKDHKVVAPAAVPEIVDVVEKLNITSLTHLDVVHTPNVVHSQAQAFGLPGRHQVLLYADHKKLKRFWSTKPAFRAVVFHELAHIANGDIERTYLSEALWFAFVFVVVSLLLGFETAAVLRQIAEGSSLMHLLTQSLPQLLFFLMQIGGMLALIGALWANLIREREFYADAQVTRWDPSMPILSGLSKIFSETQKDDSWWRRPWQFHPSLEARQKALQNPLEFARLKSDVAFFVGFLLSLIFASLILVVFAVGILVLLIPEIWIAAVLAQDLPDTSFLVRFTHFAIPLLSLPGTLMTDITLWSLSVQALWPGRRGYDA
jgi:Zn-dependent protease with chaperone function